MFLRMFFIAFLFNCVAVHAQQQPMTPAEKALLRFPSSAVISPRSGDVAFAVREADTSANRWVTHIHLVNAAGVARQLSRRFFG